MKPAGVNLDSPIAKEQSDPIVDEVRVSVPLPVSVPSSDNGFLCAYDSPSGTFTKRLVEPDDMAEEYATPVSVESLIASLRASLYLYAIFRDEKASGTDGGAISSGGTWLTRTLNTEDAGNNIVGASLSGDQITLPEDTYRVVAWSVAVAGGRNHIRLYNVTDSEELAVGSVAFSANSAPYALTISFLGKVFTLDGEKQIELQHWFEAANGNSYAMGTSVSSGSPNIYSQVEIYKWT